MRLTVGDLAIITGSKFYPELIGQVCTIIEPYQERLCRMPSGPDRWLYRYVVRLSDGSTGAFSFRNLKPLFDKAPVLSALDAESETEQRR